LLAVRHPVPQGRAAAIRTGLDWGLGEVIFYADEDCRLPLDQVRRLWAALGEHEVVLARPWDETEVPGARSPTPPGGGYQVGFRRVFRRIADALGDPGTLPAKLASFAVSWHEMRLKTDVASRGLRLSTASSDAFPGSVRPDDRSVRADLREDLPRKARQPKYLVRNRRVAADE
jgi:glycosyltransferase involved in cell wall biosynthesis